MKADFSGKLAEFLAVWYLRCKGYRLLARNYVTGRGTSAGEVDIIMRKKQTLVFVEVKKRRDMSRAAYAILLRQRRRISRAAEAFVKHYPEFSGCNIRFDAVLITLKPLRLQHIPNAW